MKNNFYDGGLEIAAESAIDYMLANGKSLFISGPSNSNVALFYDDENGWTLAVYGYFRDEPAGAILHTRKKKLNKGDKEHMLSFIERVLNGSVNGEYKQFGIYTM